MQRYFIEDSNYHEGFIKVSGNDFHHIKNVMRFRIGEIAQFVNSDGLMYTAKLSQLNKTDALFEVFETIKLNQNRTFITIAQALIKRDRFELFLEKSTELQVYEIIPTSFVRSIIKINPIEEEKKKTRYLSIVKEASEQSERTFIPLISDFKHLKEIDYSSYDHVLVCFEREDYSHSLKSVLTSIKREEHVLVLVGPEGGITEKELAFFETKKAKFISLGRSILRSETASLFVLSSFLYEWEI